MRRCKRVKRTVLFKAATEKGSPHQMDQTRSRNNPPTRFRRIVSTLCMPAHCYFIPAVHAERRPAIQIHPHKSGQAEPQIPQINKTKLNITKQAKKKKTLWEVVWVAKLKAEIKWKGMISFISISLLNETVS